MKKVSTIVLNREDIKDNRKHVSEDKLYLRDFISSVIDNALDAHLIIFVGSTGTRVLKNRYSLTGKIMPYHQEQFFNKSMKSLMHLKEALNELEIIN